MLSFTSIAFLALGSVTAPPKTTRVLLLQDLTNGADPGLAALRNSFATALDESSQAERLAASFDTGETSSFAMHGDASSHLAKGQAALRALDMAQAEHHLSYALQRFQRVAVRTGDVSQLPTTLSALIAAYLLQGDVSIAAPLARRLYAVQPNYAPPPALFNPTMRRQLARLRTTATQALVSTKLTVDPADAHVYVDGQLTRPDAATIRLDPTVPHYVLATHAEHQAYTTSLSVPTPPEINVRLLSDIRNSAARNETAPLCRALRQPDAFPSPDAPLVRRVDANQIWILHRSSSGDACCIRFDMASGTRMADKLTTTALNHITSRVTQWLAASP